MQSIQSILRTGYVVDPRYRDHEVPPGHPERPERLSALLDLMNGYSREGLVKVEPRSATVDEILSNHSPGYVEQVRASALGPHVAFGLDTHAFSHSWETALLAAGGLLELLDRIVAGDIDNGFAMVRPPGHHAETDRAMGFCFFNNVAIGARYLRARHGLERILIMDWDVHHGNGTQRSFFADGAVLYVSIHQYPHYPGTGAADEVGIEGGAGYTVNLPFPGGYGDDEYLEAFRQIVEPISRQFDPDFVLISAGFDAHRLDPLSQMQLTTSGFASMTRSLVSIARDHAGGRCAAVLEGGYYLKALTESVARVLDEFGGEGANSGSHAGGAAVGFDSVRQAHEKFWTL